MKIHFQTYSPLEVIEDEENTIHTHWSKRLRKTYIGSQVNKNTDIKFLRVEPIWLKLAPGENGWERVEKKSIRSFSSIAR
jgi:hypothetical protein